MCTLKLLQFYFKLQLLAQKLLILLLSSVCQLQKHQLQKNRNFSFIKGLKDTRTFLYVFDCRQNVNFVISGPQSFHFIFRSNALEQWFSTLEVRRFAKG